MIKLQWNRRLFGALRSQCPEGFTVSYQGGFIVVRKEDDYYSPWYCLDEIVEQYR